MSQSLKFLWSFAVDGGGVGPHLMRGSRLPDFGFYSQTSLVELQSIGWGAAGTFDVKTDGGTVLLAGIDSTYVLGAAPGFLAPPDSTPRIHLPPAEYLVLQINSNDLTAGQVEVVLEFVEY